jgi:hypothetical protein
LSDLEWPPPSTNPAEAHNRQREAESNIFARFTTILQIREAVLMADIAELEDQLSWALSRISELEELLEEAYLNHRRMVAGEPAEWWC